MDKNVDAASPSFAPYAITFIAGASYGFTTVLVGQPLDTIKTRMQGLRFKASSSKMSLSAVGVFRDLYTREGVRGLYRGGLPLLLGGSIMRSAQFGVSAEARNFLERIDFPRYKLIGTTDSTVLLAGIAGGLGRALVEIPTDFFKIRRQVQQTINRDGTGGNMNRTAGGMIRTDILKGSLVTMSRNVILFASFIVYIDLSKQACNAGVVPNVLCTADGTGLTPFAKGAICANMAWMTCWPMDVVKTQRQSGNYESSASSLQLLKDNIRAGKFFRGLIPGLARSTIANGSSMVMYETVHSRLSELLNVKRKDMV